MVPTLLLTLGLLAQAPNPNDPGLIDPIAAHWLQAPVRLPGSLQVHGASELVNIVGQVRRRDVDQVTSRRNAQITSTDTPKEDAIDATAAMANAAAGGNIAAMQTAAQELQDVLLGDTLGEPYDGFPLLNHVQANPLADQLPGEYRIKQAEDRGKRVPGVLGGVDVVWELDVALLYAEDTISCDTAAFILPHQARRADRLQVRYLIYSLERADFVPATLLDDHQVFGEGRLPSKGFDAVWLPLQNKGATLVRVDHGTVGALRSIQVWNWRATPDASTTIQPLRQILDPSTGQPRLDARGTVVLERLRSLDLAAVGDASVVKKLLVVAQAALAGTAPAQIDAMLTQANVGPAGTAVTWLSQLNRRDQLPQEAWDLLALEGIFPGPPGTAALGPYHAVAVFTNHQLHMVSTDVLGHDPITGAPILIPGDQQGETVLVKVFNLDAISHNAQLRDYGPELHNDWETCSNAPAGEHSLEIFSDKALYGAPKQAELQWRTGWSLRRDFGIVPQFDVFPRPSDQLGLLAWTDGAGARLGWQYPASIRGGDFALAPPPSWLGGAPSPGEIGGGGLVIGTTTPGYGTAKMPAGNLAALHPLGLLNRDLDGDGILDALIFPAWMRNPDLQGGDFIPATEHFEPFLYLSPANGTQWIDSNQPALGYWSDLTYAFGTPVAAGSDHVAQIVKPRAMGQAMWLFDGLFNADAGMATRSIDSDRE